MSEVFYRKWRPRRLDQVIGQEPVTQTLRNAVSLGRVAHAYLLCGPRGTGKTSTARILAKAVNCLSPSGGEPDNECHICVSINEGRALDLIEIDAASNRGIDDIRNLSDKIHFTPNEARYKVYIIDEVHMLTEPAFNALLKTLEEPPGHAILVLATTEPHKVPLTIISRCQRFDFRRIPIEAMVDRLVDLCRDEGVDSAPEALRLICRTSSGSLRDAENLLEQAVVSYGTPLTEEHLRDLMQLGGEEEALELVGHVVNRAVRDGLTVINQVAGQGSDLRQLHRGTMEFLRGVMLLKADAAVSFGYAEDATKRLKAMVGQASMDHLVHALKTFAKVDLRHDSSTPLPLELAMVESSTVARLEPSPVRPPGPASPEAARTVDRPPDGPARARTRAPQAAPVQSRTSPAPASRPPAPRDAPEDRPAVAASGPAAKLDSEWGGILRSLRHTGKRFKMGALLRGCRAREISDGLITVKFLYSSHVDRMRQELEDPETRRVVAEVLSKAMGAPYEVRPSLIAEDNATAGRGAAHRSHLVRAAQAMGARVVDEKQEEPDEQEDASPGAAATEEDDGAPGGT